MSTNYYWIRQPTDNSNELVCLKCTTNDNSPENHIGKVSGTGYGRLDFIWCQKPDVVIRYCEKFYNKKIIVNEYLDELTGTDFLRLMGKIDEEFFENIGTWFT